MDLFSNNYNYDIIIVGGGISGLFTAYKLSKTNLKILLLEMHEELGGRVHTIYKTDFYYECAAARFHRKHTKLLSLINELGLKDKILPLPKKVNYFLRNKDTRYYYNSDEKLNLKDLLKEAIEQKKEIKKQDLINITFFQYLMTIYDSETVQYIKDTFGYDSEIMNLNAHAAIKMFKDDLLSEEDYYVLDGGLSQIIQRMEEEIILKENVFIKRKTKIIDIEDNKVITGKKDKFKYEKLILTIPSEKLKEIEYFKGKVLFDSVKPMKLLRIYAKYPTKKLWFKGIKRTITDNYIRHIIPINEEVGLIMISYSDDIYAEMWNRYSNISENFLITMLHKEIEKIFGIYPPEPDFLSTHYWENGIHLWDTGYDIDEEYEKMLKPIDNKEIYICGESFSKKQGWIEGSLETTYDVIKSLNLKGYNVENKKNDVGNLKKKKTQKDTKKEDKIKNEDKKYDIKTVIENKTWIVMDHDEKKGIYDIKKWIPKHPGGAVILKGIEANKHYENPKKYKKSPYEIWKRIHSEDILKKYFIEKNEWVIPIGYLK
jgi:monoamine oxidase